jgi:hypothetical protein
MQWFLSFNQLNIYILDLTSPICDINRTCIFLREYFPEVGHKKTEKCGRITACLYGIVSNYSAILGIHMVTSETTLNSKRTGAKKGRYIYLYICLLLTNLI